MSITNAALSSEITNNPNNLTDVVSGKTLQELEALGADSVIASVLNLVRSGGTYSVFRNDVQPKEIIQAIAPADFTGANQLQISKLQLLLAFPPIDMSLANVRGDLQALFSSASQPTKDALVAIASRQGSRGEILGGIGTIISEQNVGQARNGS